MALTWIHDRRNISFQKMNESINDLPDHFSELNTYVTMKVTSTMLKVTVLKDTTMLAAETSVQAPPSSQLNHDNTISSILSLSSFTRPALMGNADPNPISSSSGQSSSSESVFQEFSGASPGTAPEQTSTILKSSTVTVVTINVESATSPGQSHITVPASHSAQVSFSSSTILLSSNGAGNGGSGIFPTPTPLPDEPAHNGSDTTTITIATIVPVVLVALCILACLWWWRNRTRNKKEKDDLEREAVWVTKKAPLSPPPPLLIHKHRRKLVEDALRNDSNDDTTNDNVVRSPVEADGGAVATAAAWHWSKGTGAQKQSDTQTTVPIGKGSSVTQKCPSLDKSIAPISTTQVYNDFPEHFDTIALDDPFRTPLTPTPSLPDLTNDPLDFNDRFRASQVGLAVSTPESVPEPLSKLRSQPTSSVPQLGEGKEREMAKAESVRTVLHHPSDGAQNHSENLQDMPTSPQEISAFSFTSSSDSSTSPQSVLSNGSVVAGHVNTITQRKTSEDEPYNELEQGEKQLSKSQTPPEELARRWIEVLNMETAQANEAAEVARKRATELRESGVGGNATIASGRA